MSLEELKKEDMTERISIIGKRIKSIYFNGTTYHLAVDDEKRIYIKNVTVNGNDEPEPPEKGDNEWIKLN